MERPTAGLSTAPRNGRRRLLLVATSALASLVLCGAIYSATRVHNAPVVISPPASSVLGAGAEAPLGFSLDRLGGSGSASLAALVGHKPAVVNFFASWCTACAAELDAFGRVSRQEGSAVRFIGIDTNDPNHALALQLLQRAGAHYPVLLDSAAQRVATAYGVSALPTTFFIDASGHVTAEALGAQQATALAARVVSLERRGD